MATFYVAEYSSPGVSIAHGVVQIAQAPALAEQTKPISGASAQLTLSAGTRFIRIHTDAICSFLIGNPSVPGGNNPVATAANSRLAANQTEYYGVTPGSIIAVIVNT